MAWHSRDNTFYQWDPPDDPDCEDVTESSKYSEVGMAWYGRDNTFYQWDPPDVPDSKDVTESSKF